MTNETTVVNIHHKIPYDVYCGRAGKGQDGYFGNPNLTLTEYKKYFYWRLEKDPEFKERIHQLKGKILGCFCKPKPCHVDTIKEYLDNL